MQNKEILLLRPQNLYGLQNYPPLGLILIGSVLTQAGYGVKILIGNGRPEFARQVAEQAGEALFVGITATTAEIQDAIALARALRQRHGHRVPLVWGGWHATLFSEQMEKSPLVDFAVLGDGEEGILQIAQTLSSSRGEAYQENPGEAPGRKILRTPFVDLNTLPLARYDLLPEIETFITQPLTDKFQEYYPRALRWLPYQSSRGCPYSCAFCINPTTNNRKYRAQNPVKTAQELAEIVTRHRLTHVKIIDDNFFVQIGRVREIFGEVERLGVKFTWDAESRLDYIRPGFMDDAMFNLLKRNGLVQLTFGIESGSPDTLKRMRKGYRAGPEYALQAMEMCAKYDLAVRGSFVLDIPGDSPGDIMETVKLIRRLRRYPKFACGVHTFRPYPRSPLCDSLLKEGKFYQPASLEAWSDTAAIRPFTDTAAERVWQANYTLSSRVSFYESLESGFWLKPHQLTHPLASWLNRGFMLLAKLRNRQQFYALPWDKALYLPFKDFCIRHLAHKDRLAKGVANQWAS